MGWKTILQAWVDNPNIASVEVTNWETRADEDHENAPNSHLPIVKVTKKGTGITFTDKEKKFMMGAARAFIPAEEREIFLEKLSKL